MKRFLLDPGKADPATSLGLLILRLGCGILMILGHGWPKLRDFSAAKEFFPVPSWFEAVMTPEISLVLAIAVELLGAGCLMLGLLTRPAAILLGFTMFVGAFAIHSGDPWFIGDGKAKEPALLYLIPSLALILSGAGRYSLDHVIRK